MATLVLGSGIVGSAAAWDLVRRGHEVVVADSDLSAAEQAASVSGATPLLVDAGDNDAIAGVLERFDVVVSAIPYRFGHSVAAAAVASRTHYLDFGGNPTVVAQQKALHDESASAGITIIPDCGLAPGLANVLAEDLIVSASNGIIDSIQIRVGALPQVPVGALGYQLAFSTAGLINEYAEPCEVIENGKYTTVEPLTRLEPVAWERWGPLEAFSTAGGTSTMPTVHQGRVSTLEYKTLRYPGHGVVFRSLLEMGMFEEHDRSIAGINISPRGVLIDALDHTLPSGAPDVALIRVWRDQDGTRTTLQVTDTEQGGFSALARTTAFPATALADLIVRGEVSRPGVYTMHEAVFADALIPELEPVGIVVEDT